MQKIDLDSRLELFRGCVTPGVRMNEALLDFYSDSEARVIRARSASGVRVAFMTDAVEMTYSFTCGGCARKIFTTDVVINGEKSTLEGEGLHKITMEPGEKSVVIHLPHLIIVNDLEIALNDGAFVKEMALKEKKLLICGDSILQGMTCTTPTKAVGTLLAEKLDVEFHNTSVGGAEMRFEPVEQTLTLGGDAVVVCFGINDAAHGVAHDLFRERTRRVLELLKDFSGKSFIIVPIPNMNVDAESREALCRIIREEQRAFPEVTIIEGASFYPACNEFFVDGTHPNDEGMKIYAEALAEIIAPVLG